MLFSFDNRYLQLGDEFYTKTRPTAVTAPKLIQFNVPLAEQLQLHFNTNELKTLAPALFSGNQIPEGAEPIAMAYAGHQFGGFNPQLGDGRAILLGEVLDQTQNRYDIQLKGAGITPFSRNGDGRSALGPALREYLVSEAMHRMGVPSTRALALVTYTEPVWREKPVAGGILTRISKGYVRIGTFEYFHARQNCSALKKLADHVIQRHYPELQSEKQPYQSLLIAVIQRQAKLIAQWMSLGFIHGVMNTDNVSINGETLDYGPCAFMDFFQHQQVYSSIDHQGRYAYANQPQIGQWNLIRFAETLLFLFAENSKQAVAIAEEALEQYRLFYQQEWLSLMRQKIGLFLDESNDTDLIQELFDIMEKNNADFTLTFYYLSQFELNSIEQPSDIHDLFQKEPILLTQWLKKWFTRLNKEKRLYAESQKQMQRVNPLYIPRNHQIEAIIRAAEDNQDFTPFYALHDVLKNPYQWQTDKEKYAQPPRPKEIIKYTFCGT